ncbi:zinc-binding alcohol dehydrogenase-like protein [Venturia nashicola]|uniref:Zinc-binding alcohol dehydrogenase-like protein n=1 Tax=Venturia nashicola TaxID=86259 RepID=A0A4Z1PWG5_9PEZI|nr:zinc-binding alcohol dehydrogenase-like protein [Venturia nashicola]TLD39311.1 zinc-binding alcohol dehydrogenase-like protein [Venturia nashicola]
MGNHPTHTARWTLPSQNGIESLRYEESAAIPDLNDYEVLVEMHAASINYRDLVITKSAENFPLSPSLIPGSDGSGKVILTGSSVSSFKIGDRVVTHLVPFTEPTTFPTLSSISTGMGQQLNGTLAQYAVFPESCLLHAPKNLSSKQTATLTCSGLTAWNACMGLKGREVKKGDWVLVQGSGGVSVAALQFAVAAGATVIATTSSNEKTNRLKALGASHIINYRTDPKWGQTAKALTPNSRGLDLVIDVGGDNTLAQSLAAIRVDGLIVAAGLVAGAPGETRPALMDALWNVCIVRGILLGTRQQFGDMVRFIEQKEVDIAIDEEAFGLKDAKEAYRKLETQKHFSKIVVKVR